MSGGARRVWLVARREWDQRVRTVSFRLSTLISIALVLVIILVPDALGAGDERTRTVGVAGRTSSELPPMIDAAGDQMGLIVETRSFADEAAGRAALRSDRLAVLLVDEERLVWKAEQDDGLQVVVASAVQTVERQRAVAELGLSSAEAQRLLAPPDLASTSLQPVSAERTDREELAWIALVVLFMAIAFYGGFVLTGVIEEKSSRVVEVLLSRLQPPELLAGKILGIGLVGLAQLGIIAAAALIALRFGENPSASTAPGTIAWIVFWFVLGYGFYSVLFATAGSLVSRQEEAQSIQFPVTGILLVAYIFSMEVVRTPESTAAVIGSLLPPTAPMLMIGRIAYGDVPLWQIMVSVALMVLTVIGLVLLAGRIYSGGALRFGGRLGLREAWRGAEA